MSHTYCHTHSAYDCQTCADEILSLGIQVDKDRIAALELENKELRANAAELATLREKAARFETVALSRCADRIKLLWIEQEWDDLRKDAERYRWLRDGNDNRKSAACHIAVNCYGLEWDDAIDAAIAQEGE